MNLSQQYVVLLLALISLTGCTSTPKEEIFQEGGPTTEQIFNGSTSRSPQERHFYGWSDGDLQPYTRDQDNELSSTFPELRNRRLNLYVFPHITPEGAPVPGYTTSFYLYDHTRLFALPGETREEVIK